MIDHKTVSLADQVFEHLETDILSGKYRRGEVLTETKLSAELGVSRTPIREALRRLEQEHIIEESGKGSVVIGINENDVDDIFLIREQLEGIVAAAAAKKITPDRLNALREAVELQEFYLEKQDAEQIKHMDNRFHEMLYKASGSTTFYDILVPLHKKVQKYRKSSVERRSRAVVSVAEHQAIYAAIAAGDCESAEKLTREHVHNAYLHIKGKDK